MDCVQDSRIEPFKAPTDCETEAMDYQDCKIEPFKALQHCDAKAMESVQDCHMEQFKNLQNGKYNIESFKALEDCETESMDYVQECKIEPFNSLQVQDSEIELFKAIQDCETEVMDYQDIQIEPLKAVQLQDCETKALNIVPDCESKPATSLADAPQQGAAASVKSVRFKPEVDVLHFHRQMSPDGIPMDKKGFPVGMSYRPFRIDTRPLPEMSPNVKRVKPRHYSFSQRRELLLHFLAEKMSTPSGSSEVNTFTEELHAVNKSRANSLEGCGCREGVCDPHTCSCFLSEIPCHAYTCLCRVGCGNEYGRVMSDRATIRRHYDLTFRRLRLDN